MATIHKLTKDGATIFPATITDAVVHPQTGKTLTSMMKDYNVSELFPTEGIGGGNKYNLALAIQVLGTHLSAAQKTGGIKLTFISSVSPYPEEEYYLSKSTWSATASDWDQRFEVGDVVADPSGSWEPSTAQQYIDGKVAVLNTSIASETLARQTGDRNLQTNLTSEMNTRASQDANLNALINAGIREGGGVEFDIVPTQNSANGITSGGMYNTLRDSNLGFVDDVPTAGSDNLVRSGGIISSLMIPSEEWEYQNKYVTDNLQIGNVITYNDVQSGWMSFKVFVPKGSTVFLYNIVTNSSAHHIYITNLSECVIEIIDKIGDNNTRHDYEYTATRDCFVVSSSGLNSAVYVNTSTPSQSVLTKIYTYANMSYQGYFRSVDAEVGKVLDLSPERIIYNASYRTEIVKVNRGAVINIINFPSISECPYIIITDINKKIITLISTNIEYTFQEPGYIVFSMASSHLLNVTIDYNSPFHDNSVVYKDVDVMSISDKDCYYSTNDFVVGNKCNILKTTSVSNPAANPQNAIRPIILFLKAGESALLFRPGYEATDNGEFAVIDAETFVCISRVSFNSPVSGKIVEYTEYVASQDVYILANGIGLNYATNIKISPFAESFKSIDSCLESIIARNGSLKVVDNRQWSPGYVGADGAFNYTGSGNHMVSVFFKIPTGNQKICLMNILRENNTGMSDVAFYDADMNFISGIGGSTTGYYTMIGGTKDIISVPDNAVYYRLTQKASNFIVNTKVYVEHEDIFALKSVKIDACNNTILARSTGFIEKGLSPWSISEAIRCTPGTIVFFNFSEAYNEYVAQVVVYDKNGMMLTKMENSTGYIKIPDNAEFFRMTLNNGTIPLNANSNVIDCYCDKQNGISLYNPSIKKVPNLLVIGDSYSQQQNWIRSLRQFVNIDTIVNLARGSATMKDQFTDRTQYPYTSRPQNGDNGSARRQNNLNTFCCQLALLDRLMEGTDLDAGETQLYTDPSTYPNLIIIQGGKNDAVENDVTINSYANIIRDKVTAYARRSNEDNPTQQSVCLVKSVDSVDRTTFIGAMYVLYETLHQKFPNAVIVFVNPSNLQYGNADVWYDAAKSDAMDIASKILSVPIIDWNRQGRLSYIFDHITTGDGTQANPYIVNSPTELTSDMLHPNVKGATYLGKVAAKFLNAYL